VPGHVCIHGHFYQPPREDPWTETVPRQPSAHPAHDWNHRITEECYRPNAAARLLGRGGRIRQVVSNYARVSFDAGPTLLRWLARHAPDVHDAMIEGDRAAVARWGHGTAIAQAYHHAILPLLDARDRRTEIRWALRDFAHRFGRESEGIWLPECAVDVATLEDVAAAGIRFTILAPQQVEAVRERGGRWRKVGAGGPDPRRPYRVPLPSGAHVDVFVYDGPTSQAVAFEGLLEKGERLADRVRHLPRAGDELGHIATDGESYGHHHRFGDMALAYALELLEAGTDVRLTPYAAFLATHPPTAEARIVSPSSWSCVHGVERWRSDCGCGTAPGGGRWRAPLRAAVDRLAERVDARWEPAAAELLDDPWSARDDYVDCLLEPGRDAVDAWLDARARRPLDEEDRRRVLGLLELQRFRLMAFTSCAWFFDDLDRLEPIQILKHAWRAVDLAADLFPDADLAGPLRRDLAQARSGRPRGRTGPQLLDREVRPCHRDGLDAAAFHALTHAIRPGSGWWRYRVDEGESRERRIGPGRLTVTRVEVEASRTRRRDRALTVCWSAPGVLKAGSLPDDGRELEDLLAEAAEDPPTTTERLAERQVAAPQDLTEEDRDRLEQQALELLEADLVRLSWDGRRWSHLLPDPDDMDSPPAVRAAAWAWRHAHLEQVLVDPSATASAHLPSVAASLPGAGEGKRLRAAAREGLLELVGGLDGARPETLDALLDRVQALRTAGLLPDLWEAQNAVLALLQTPATAGWHQARRRAAELLHLDVDPLSPAREGPG
jgi:hypothetical protein